MNFITNLVARHTSPNNNVKPRARSRFETGLSGGIAGNGFKGQDSDKTNSFYSNLENSSFDRSQNEPGHLATGFNQNKVQDNPINPSENPSLNAQAAEGFNHATERQNTASNIFMDNINPNKKEERLDSFATSSNRDHAKMEEQRLNGGMLPNDFAFGQNINREIPREQYKQNEQRNNLVEFNPTNQERNALNETSTRRRENDENPFSQIINKNRETNTVETSTVPNFEGSAIKPSIKKSSPTDSFQNDRIVPNTKKLASEPWRQEIKELSDKLFNTQKPPTINVTIGRIEVRALVQPTPAPIKSKPSAKPQMSLEDYLKQQNSHAR